MIIAALAAAALASDPAFERVTERARACLRSNAADVERSEPSLSDAATFLVDDLCAVPVDVRERYQASAMMLANMRSSGGLSRDDEDGPLDAKTAERMKKVVAKQRAAYARATISEETGEVLMPPGSADGTTYLIMTGVARESAGPELRAYAAKLILDARKSRLGNR